MSKKITKQTERALLAAAALMTPQQRLKAIPKVMLAGLEHQQKDIPIELETQPFAIFNDDIKTLTVEDFIDIIIRKVYTKLILAGEPTEAQITEAIEDIMFHYQDAVMDDKTDVYIKSVAKIHEIQIKLNRVNMNIEALKVIRDEGIISELKEDGFNYEFSEDSYEKDIQRINTALKRDTIQYNKIKRQIVEMQSSGKSGKPLTADDIYTNLAELRKFENYQSEPYKLAQELSLYGYCQALKRYNKHIELLKKQAEHGKLHG